MTTGGVLAALWLVVLVTVTVGSEVCVCVSSVFWLVVWVTVMGVAKCASVRMSQPRVFRCEGGMWMKVRVGCALRMWVGEGAGVCVPMPKLFCFLHHKMLYGTTQLRWN